MAFVQLEDMVGSVELIVFAKSYAKFELLLKTDEPLLVKAKLEEITEEGTAKLLCEDVRMLSEVRETETEQVLFQLNASEATDSKLTELRELIERYPGQAGTAVQYTTEGKVGVTMALPEEFKVRPSREMVEAVETVFGRRVAAFR
jgi:DNA polymerase-3 subunit alpha